MAKKAQTLTNTNFEKKARVYKCSECKNYHLTTQPEAVNRYFKKLKKLP